MTSPRYVSQLSSSSILPFLQVDDFPSLRYLRVLIFDVRFADQSELLDNATLLAALFAKYRQLDFTGAMSLSNHDIKWVNRAMRVFGPVKVDHEEPWVLWNR